MNTSLQDRIAVFENAPISLWIEDYSELKRALDGLRASGVVDLDAYLESHPEATTELLAGIRILDVNRKTLALFGAESKEELIASTAQIFRDEMRQHFRGELLDMWAGKHEYQREGINYALTGEAIEIFLHWAVMPGCEDSFDCILVSIEDMREFKNMQRKLVRSDAYFRGMFDHSPVSLWEEDYSQVVRFFARLRADGVTDLADYLDDHPEAVDTCMGLVQVLNVNQKTLSLFGAASKEELSANLSQIFRDEMRSNFQHELIQIWNGKTEYSSEGINYSLSGDPIEVEVHWAVQPGHEQDFGRVLVSVNDITIRKRAERYMQYLGTHDVLTSLYNRHYYQEECQRLQNGRRFPVSILIIDLDGLKGVNDQFGHGAGDDLLRRTSEVLRHTFRTEDVAARIGGDEFAVVLPETDENAAAVAVARVHKMLEVNNTYYRTPLLSLSIGAATGRAGSVLEQVMRDADDAMYRDKRGRKQARSPSDTINL